MRGKVALAVPVINASNAVELTQALRDSNHNPREVFFKAYKNAGRKYRKYMRLPFSHFSDKEVLEQQVEHLAILHQISPETIVEPLAIVMQRDVFVGYLAEKAHGMSMERLWERASGEIKVKNQKRFINLFVNAAEIVISTIEMLHQNGQYHGDIAKRNVIVSSSGKTYIFDPIIWPSAFLEDEDRIKSFKEEIASLRA